MKRKADSNRPSSPTKKAKISLKSMFASRFARKREKQGIVQPNEDTILETIERASLPKTAAAAKRIIQAKSSLEHPLMADYSNSAVEYREALIEASGNGLEKTYALLRSKVHGNQLSKSGSIVANGGDGVNVSTGEAVDTIDQKLQKLMTEIDSCFGRPLASEKLNIKTLDKSSGKSTKVETTLGAEMDSFAVLLREEIKTVRRLKQEHNNLEKRINGLLEEMHDGSEQEKLGEQLRQNIDELDSQITALGVGKDEKFKREATIWAEKKMMVAALFELDHV